MRINLWLLTLFVLNLYPLKAQTFRDTIKVIQTEELFAESVNGEFYYIKRPSFKKIYSKREGYNEIYDEHGNLYFTGSYTLKDTLAVENGMFRFYYPDGKIKQEGTYSNGKRAAIWKHYTKAGILEYILNYNNAEKTYLYPNGAIRAIGSYDIIKNEHNGRWTFYYDNGTCECEGQYYSSLKYGLWKYYFNTGSLREKERHAKYTDNYNYKFLEACKW